MVRLGLVWGTLVLTLSGCAGRFGHADSGERLRPTPSLRVDIVQLVQRLRSHPYTQYHGAENKYSFFVGNMLYAEYRPALQRLTIRDDGPQGGDVHCDFSIETTAQATAAVARACSRLLTALDNQLDE